MTDRQMFKLVDANTVPSTDGSCGCGCGGEGEKARAEQAAPAQAPAEQGGCGCGGHGGGHGHGHAAQVSEAPAEHAGCGCGGHEAPAERPHEMAAEPIASTAGGCGCGDGAPSAGNVQAGGAGVIHRPGADELVIHSIPRVVRHAVLFAAVDNLPVGENIQICAPHQPEPLFAHLQDSEQHYRVETLEVGPVDWRYRITRLA
ncbi:MAG: hemerythrin HHE cation-binding protein [Actinomyces sp.]|nr:MAG: hemerythrin HHE cation-binding protein [Actinomyces sp.]